MIFGMPTLIEIKTLDATMQLCKELNLSFVELNMNLPQYQIEVLENTAKLIELRERYGIGYTIHLDENLNVWDFNRAVASAYVETVLRTIEVAEKIDALVLNMHMNHGVHFTLPDRKVQLFEEYYDEYKNSWNKFTVECQKAIGDSDIKICIENTNGFRSYEKRILEDILREPVFKLTWDIGHSHASGNADEAFMIEHQNKLRHFHIHDAKGSKDHMILGSGEVDLRERLAMAEKYNCRCVVETKTVEALRQSVEWLKRNDYYGISRDTLGMKYNCDTFKN